MSQRVVRRQAAPVLAVVSLAAAGQARAPPPGEQGRAPGSLQGGGDVGVEVAQVQGRGEAALCEDGQSLAELSYA